MTKNDDIVLARLFLLGREGAAQHWLLPEYGKQAGRNLEAVKAFREIAAVQICAPGDSSCQIFKNLVLPAPVEKVGGSSFVQRIGGKYELFRLFVGQRAQHQGIHETEN